MSERWFERRLAREWRLETGRLETNEHAAVLEEEFGGGGRGCMLFGFRWRRSLGGAVSWAVRVALVAGRWVCMYIKFDVERVDGCCTEKKWRGEVKCSFSTGFTTAYSGNAMTVFFFLVVSDSK